MSFTLLNELNVIKEAQILEETYPLMESVGSFLQVLVAKIKNKPDTFLQNVNIQTLARQISGLWVLGKSANRKQYDDFQDLDKIFDNEEQNADDFLEYIGTTDNESKLSAWLKLLNDAKKQDKEAIEKLTKFLDQLNNHYATVMKTLSAEFMNKQFDKAAQSSQSDDGLPSLA
jgi:hypothetical protein